MWLRSIFFTCTRGGGGSSSGKTQALEQKMFKLQEELTDMHRKKGEVSIAK